MGEAGLAVRCFARTAAAISTSELCSPPLHLPALAIFHPVYSANRSLILVFIPQEVKAGFAVFTRETLSNTKGVLPATGLRTGGVPFCAGAPTVKDFRTQSTIIYSLLGQGWGVKA